MARQQRASGEAVDEASGSVFEGIDEGDGPNADPNQCSSPYSTELLHRKVANQHKGVADPARLTSPLGAELLQRKVARQQRASGEAVDEASGSVFEGMDEDDETDPPEDHAPNGAAEVEAEEPRRAEGAPAAVDAEVSSSVGADADVADRESCAEDLTDDLKVAHAQDAAVITLQSRARVSLSRKLTAERRAFIEAAEAATEAQLDEIDRQAREAEILAASKTRMKRPSLLAALTVETVDSPEPHGVDTLSSPIGAALVNRKAAFQSSVSSPIGAALVNRKAAFQSSVSSPIGAALVNRKAAFQRRAEQPGPDDTAGAVAVKIVRQAIDEVLAEEGSALIDEDAAEAKRVARRAIEAALLAPTSAEPNGPDDAGASTPHDLLSSMVGLDEVVIDEEADEAKGYGKMRKHKRMSTTPFNDASSAFAAAEDEGGPEGDRLGGGFGAGFEGGSLDNVLDDESDFGKPFNPTFSSGSFDAQFDESDDRFGAPADMLPPETLPPPSPAAGGAATSFDNEFASESAPAPTAAPSAAAVPPLPPPPPPLPPPPKVEHSSDKPRRAGSASWRTPASPSSGPRPNTYVKTLTESKEVVFCGWSTLLVERPPSSRSLLSLFKKAPAGGNFARRSRYFALTNASELLYYEQPRGTQELKLDGKMDLSSLSAIERDEPESATNFAFRVVSSTNTIRIDAVDFTQFQLWQQGLVLAMAVPTPGEQAKSLLRHAAKE